MSDWSPNIILVDADYLDRVVHDMVAHFEPVIGRQLPPADLCHWLDCLVLDAGLREGKHAVQVVFLHAKERQSLQHFTPAHYVDELDGKAFEDHIGEFTLQSFPVEPLVTMADFFVQSLEAAATAEAVQRLLVVGDMEAYGETVVSKAAAIKDKDVMLFSMRPLEAPGCRQEILGYSLLAALGIRSDEL